MAATVIDFFAMASNLAEYGITVMNAAALLFAGCAMLVTGLAAIAIRPKAPYNARQRRYESLIVSANRAAKVLAAVGAVVLLAGILGLVLA